MTRKEQILQAARDYVSGVTLSSPSDVIHFEYGARWADEHPVNVLHDANDEPLLEGKEIIFLNNHDLAYITERFGGTFSDMLEDYSWEKYVNLCKITKWAYISDLLPKGGQK